MTLKDKLQKVFRPEMPFKKSNLGLHSQDRIYWVPTNPNSKLILQRTQDALRNKK